MASGKIFKVMLWKLLEIVEQKFLDPQNLEKLKHLYKNYCRNFWENSCEIPRELSGEIPDGDPGSIPEEISGEITRRITKVRSSRNKASSSQYLATNFDYCGASSCHSEKLITAF